MTDKSYTFIIVPGSFATPALYDTLATHLRNQGHDVRVIDLPSANDGTRMPPPTMEDDASHIRAAVLSALDDATKPKNVVLFLHSYSGIPGSSALRGFSKADRSAGGKHTAVIGILYLASFILQMGQSDRQTMIDFDAMPEPARTGVPGGYLPAIDPTFGPFVFNDLGDAKDVEKYMAMMTRHSSDSYDGKVSYEAWMDIPSVQIIPDKDLIIPVPIQEAMYERAKEAGGRVTRVLLEGAGHVAQISKMEVVAAEMVKLAESQSL